MTANSTEIRVLSPTGVIGSGFIEASFEIEGQNEIHFSRGSKCKRAMS
jgi:hypothetical protein